MYQLNPKESHLKPIKRIFKYLLDTKDLDLWYPKNEYFDLIEYSNADIARCKLDRCKLDRKKH